MLRPGIRSQVYKINCGVSLFLKVFKPDGIKSAMFLNALLEGMDSVPKKVNIIYMQVVFII